MYTLIKTADGSNLAVDSDFDLGIMLTLCHLNRQFCSDGTFKVVDGAGVLVWPV